MSEDDLIATPGDPEADSYLTLDDADGMAEKAGLPGWLAGEDEAKNAALRRAALDIDSHRFHGQAPFFRDQARIFPRRGDGGEIPEAVKWAALFQADFLLASGAYDAGKWEGAKGTPMKDAGAGSPLCPAAFRTISRLISRAGSYAA